MNSFEKYDLIQCRIARFYEREHGASVVSIGFAPKWDIRFTDGATVEVKVDELAAKTLNAAIEFWDVRRNIGTGILATEAQLWLHCVPQGEGLRCYELKTKTLLRLCFETGSVRDGGDNGASRMKLIPLQELVAVSERDFILEV